MTELLIYLIKSAVCLGALYLIYWFFLRKETFFAANRFYLIASIILSFILPLFKIPVYYESAELTYVIVLEAVTISAQKVEAGLLNNLSFYQIVLIVYLTGAALFLMRFIFQMLQLVFLINKFGVTKMNDLKVVKLDRKYSPFSYFNFIFLNDENFKDKNLKEIIDHEKIHIRQKHSIDLILIEVLTIIQWFNPFIWFYKASIKGIHEYLADNGLLTDGLNKATYQNLLLNQSVGIQINDLTNNFNQSLIKKRFIMMTKLQSKKIAKLKLLLVLPVAAVLFICFTFSANQKVIGQSSVNEDLLTKTEKPIQDVKAEKQEEKIFVIVEKMPEFQGGKDAQIKFMATNIKYPQEARKAGIQGMVYVTYVVEKDGSITDVRVLRGIGGGCDEEAVRVINTMPNWMPGTQRGEPVCVQFNLPIRFILDGDGVSKNKETTVFAYSVVEKTPQLVNEQVFSVVEEMPEFKAQEMTLIEFLSTNIKYPAVARKEGIEGTVFVTFIVEKDGSLNDIKLLRGIGGGCDQEAMRVVKLLSFTPGKQKGKEVAVQYNLPIKFSLK